MSASELPDELYRLLDGTNLADKRHEAMQLLTVSEDGWPHAAMISVGELVAINRSSLRLGLWVNTTTAHNLIRTGKAMLVAVYNGKAFYVRLAAQLLPMLQEARHARERFAAEVADCRTDIAKYADIRSGVRIELKDAPSVIERWEETIRDLLK